MGAILAPLNSDLSTATTVTPLLLSGGANPTGDFCIGVGCSGFVGQPGTGGVVNLLSINSYVLSFTFGTFTATSGTITSRNAGFLNVVYVGTFVGAGPLDGDSNPATVSVGVTRSGNSVSYNGTLATQDAELPEPSTYMMAGAGLAGLLLLRKRRR